MTPSNKSATYFSRQKKLIKILENEKVECLLITHIPHIRYFTGFSGSSAVLIAEQADQYTFFTDFRYKEQAESELKECSNCKIKIIKNDYWDSLAEYLINRSISRIAFQNKYLTCHQYGKIKKNIPFASLFPMDEVCEKITIKKDEWEISAIHKAAKISDALFLRLQRWCKKDITETGLCAKLEYEGRMLKSEGVSFPSIIASGKKASLPHAQASNKKIKKGEMVLADYGQKVNGYCSDMTRTISKGKAGSRLKEIYHIVLAAQENAIKQIKAGVPCKEIDNAARSIIRDAGYAEQFGHGLGHGVGIEVHENPRISPLSNDILEEGTVITIEPGIYIPGWGGVRIEDLIVVTSTGYINLVSSKKTLIEI